MNILTLTGLSAACFTTFAFAPQMLKTLKTHNTASISILMYLMYMVGVLLWIGYGIFKPDWILILANGVGFFLALPVLYIAIHNAYAKVNCTKAA